MGLCVMSEVARVRVSTRADGKQPNLLQRNPIKPSSVEEVPPVVHDVLRSPGQQLDQYTRTKMEQRMGHDFSRVRIHANDRAAASAQAVNAVAYTVGDELIFGSDKYKPNTTEGERLLAYELAHVVQQRGDTLTGSLLGVAPSGSPSEREANHAAEALLSGRPAQLTPRSEPVS